MNRISKATIIILFSNILTALVSKMVTVTQCWEMGLKRMSHRRIPGSLSFLVNGNGYIWHCSFYFFFFLPICSVTYLISKPNPTKHRTLHSLNICVQATEVLFGAPHRKTYSRLPCDSGHSSGLQMNLNTWGQIERVKGQSLPVRHAVEGSGSDFRACCFERTLGKKKMELVWLASTTFIAEQGCQFDCKLPSQVE